MSHVASSEIKPESLWAFSISPPSLHLTPPPLTSTNRQKEIKDIKEFVELARRADISSATVKVNKKVNAKGKVFKQTKFKVRGTRYQYTLVVDDVTKAKKLQQSLPPSLEIVTV